ncbi:MAG: hypothetical protein FWG02_05975 [Holophagaceae bacterium]|nr:hypothetical protein [Holophagaceae bacterium]
MNPCDIARLSIAVDSTSARTATNDLGNLASAGSKTAKSMVALAASMFGMQKVSELVI